MDVRYIDHQHEPLSRPQGLDPGIREVVWRLRDAGVETYESCEGGDGHAYPEPTVRFHGTPDEGWRAYAVIANGKFGIRVTALKRIWTIDDGEPTGPTWEITVRRLADPDDDAGDGA